MRRPSAATRLLVALHPPWFRTRYGAELSALTDEVGLTPRVAIDLVRGATRAWMAPAVAGDPALRRRWRLEATVSTVFVCWCVALVAAAGFARGVDDAPLPGLDTPLNSALFHVAQGAFAVSVATLAAGLALYGLVGLLPAVRRRRSDVWRPIVVAVTAAGGWLALGVGVGALVQRWAPGGWPSDTGHRLVLGAVLSGWLGLGAVCAVLCIVAGPLALRRCALSPRLLRPGVAGGVLVSTALAVAGVSACACVAGLLGHQRTWLPMVPGVAGALLLTGTAAVCTVSTVRGLRAAGG